jgi:hypothetical protein
MELVSQANRQKEGFFTWLHALMEQAEPRTPRTWWLPQERIMLRLEPTFQPGGPIPERISLAYDGTGARWTVEINPPSVPGDANSLSGVGRDTYGRLWLLRQGFLRPNKDSVEVKGKAFRDASGLLPVPVSVASGPTDRHWYTVANLAASGAEIRSRTSNFVASCAEVRLQFAHDQPDAADTVVVQQLLGSPETGGTYVIPPKPATGETLVDKKQGQVWQALHAALKQMGKTFENPRHAAGYRVDGVLEGTSGPVLVEIKSDLSAASIYTGVGQLLVYRQLMPSLSTHKAVLLLPGEPRPILREAVSQLGIIIETYEASDNGQTTFSPSFKQLSGIQ